MQIITLASQKGGAGKSTFAVNLAVQADQEGSPALLIDTDPQASLSVWRQLRRSRRPMLVSCAAEKLQDIIAIARRNGRVEWVFIDGPPHNDRHIAAMMHAADLVVVPARPAVFDLAAAATTVEMAQRMQAPFFVALNAVPPKRGVAEASTVTLARKAIKGMGAPLWRGAIVQRSAYVQSLALGQAVSEFEPEGAAAQEMSQLWRDVRDAARAMARRREQAVA